MKPKATPMQIKIIRDTYTAIPKDWTDGRWSCSRSDDGFSYYPSLITEHAGEAIAIIVNAPELAVVAFAFTEDAEQEEPVLYERSFTTPSEVASIICAAAESLGLPGPSAATLERMVVLASRSQDRVEASLRGSR